VPLYPEMRVEEYLHFRGKLKGMDRRERVKRAEYCLDRCRLLTVRRRLLGTLSKGYRQRVGLADAMIHNPPILILDEATAGLDPLQIRETLALIKELGQSHTVLMSTHILSEVEAVCERVIIIANGRVGLSQRLDEIESESVILVEARGPSDQIVQSLKSVGGVASVQSKPVDDGVGSFEVRLQDEQAEVREDVSKAIAQKGWPIRRLERKRRRLEDAFFDVLRAQDPLKHPMMHEPAPQKAQPTAPVSTAPSPPSEAITKQE